MTSKYSILSSIDQPDVQESLTTNHRLAEKGGKARERCEHYMLCEVAQE